jgi:hypothetical protein
MRSLDLPAFFFFEPPVPEEVWVAAEVWISTESNFLAGARVDGVGDGCLKSTTPGLPCPLGVSPGSVLPAGDGAELWVVGSEGELGGSSMGFSGVLSMAV